jgi:hypothetical protein
MQLRRTLLDAFNFVWGCYPRTGWRALGFLITFLTSVPIGYVYYGTAGARWMVACAVIVPIIDRLGHGGGSDDYDSDSGFDWD